MPLYDLIVLGGGAAGFFAASAAKTHHPEAKVAILEKSGKVLSKVKISGGGRCNVTHACFDPQRLITYYPRGGKELLGPFHTFQPRDTLAWFQAHGVEIKEEEDGRMFPITDSSDTIIECLKQAIDGVDLKTFVSVGSVKKDGELFVIQTKDDVFQSKNLLLATGSFPQGHDWAASFGHTITPLAPSLFTFNVPSSPLLDLAGISLPRVGVSIEGTTLKERGPLLLTHWGFSGPAVLRLSAWGARILQGMNYHANFLIDWTAGEISKEALKEKILLLKKQKASQNFHLDDLIALPKNLAKRFLELLKLDGKKFAHLSKEDVENILTLLKASSYPIEGKTTYKNEFVTCGGVKLSEVDFKTMQSKLCPGLYFAGEVLDIDGITGGFNFQNAWTTGWIAGKSFMDCRQ